MGRYVICETFPQWTPLSGLNTVPDLFLLSAKHSSEVILYIRTHGMLLDQSKHLLRTNCCIQRFIQQLRVTFSCVVHYVRFGVCSQGATATLNCSKVGPVSTSDCSF